MILDMIVWGFFSAMGWMGATYVVEKVVPPKPQECIIVDKEREPKTCEIQNSK